MAVSEYNPSRFDHLGQSIIFLRDFSTYNSEKLKNLTTHKTYNWSEKEKTDEGSSLSDVIRQGTLVGILAQLDWRGGGGQEP